MQQWVIDQDHVAHIATCKSANAPAAPYIPTSVRMVDGKPEQFMPKDYIEMRVHLERTDVKDNFLGPSMVKPCEYCLPHPES